MCKGINYLPKDERITIMTTRLLNSIKEKGGELIYCNFETGSSRTRVKCQHNHEWIASAKRLIAGSWCRKCMAERYKTERLLKNPIEKAQELAYKNGGKCLSMNYINGNEKLLWECKNNHIWEAKYHNISKGSWCPYCDHFYNKKEELCRILLEKTTNEKFIKIRPKWLKNQNGNPTELDGYSEKLKVAFEYQGHQHYQTVKYFKIDENKLLEIQESDKNKEIICKEMGINLIVVPYYIEIENLSEFLYKKLTKTISENKLTKTNIDDIQFFNNNLLDEIREICKSKGGEILNTSYMGGEYKYDFRCSKGHEWKTTINIIKKDCWCIECAKEKVANSNRKYNLEFMQDLAKIKGGKFISDFYKNPNTKYEWECKYGHKWFTRPSLIMKGSWCNKCGSLKTNESNRKYTVENLQEMAKSRGGECLSKEYKNVDTKYEWKCQKGHTFLMNLTSYKNGTWCQKCRFNKP